MWPNPKLCKFTFLSIKVMTHYKTILKNNAYESPFFMVKAI